MQFRRRTRCDWCEKEQQCVLHILQWISFLNRAQSVKRVWRVLHVNHNWFNNSKALTQEPAATLWILVDVICWPVGTL